VSTRALEHIQAHAEAVGDIDSLAQIGSTIVRAHQHSSATGEKGGSTGRTNRTITSSAHPEADRPKSTSPETAKAGRSRSR
jgi:hypothetical protein